MRTPPIIIGGEFRKNPPQVLFVEHDQMIGTLAPDDPIRRSTWPFCQGERNDVGRSRMPIAWMRRVNTLPKARSLSRTIYVGAQSQGNASVIWRANHSAVGWRVTANHSNCRRPWPRTRNAKSCSKAIVGTTKRSIDAIPSAWLRRKVFHVCDGRPRLGTMYFETVDWATSKPSFRSSPWICGAPQSGFSTLILRIRSRTSLSICGRPPRGRDFHRQNALKPLRCQRTIVSGLKIVMASRMRGKPR